MDVSEGTVKPLMALCMEKKKRFIGDQAAKVISGAVWQGEEQNIEKVGRVYTAAGGVF